MPLYKLTEKRMKKRAREDEDGITDLKAAMREMGEDVDGSESGSGSEGWSESDSDDDEEDEDEDEDKNEDEDEEQDEDEDSDGDEDGVLDVDVEGLESGSDEEDEDVDEEDDASSSSSSSPIFPISLESALTDPIYPSPHNTSENLCVLCPDKVLKNDQMTKVHLESKLHKRSLKRYSVQLSTNPPPRDADPREVVDEILAEMDSGEIDVEPKADKKGMSTAQKESGDMDVEKKDKKRKRSNKKQRQEEKAKKLISSNSKDTNQQEEGQEAGEKLNRKARRLLALQNGEIDTKKETKEKQKQK
ncbi:hypothetical protein I203_105466 [Kwoniella mangroviensis CBS 8507]|uniref:uncharacterized protein n=1 Tax=Kwoniella mangroviensis CBS 8507 TaxID=1296122 RepID=UPI00080CFB95|nr:uncharacterized protein I203_01278 [Kwoniella mangroviensis CBS 8507]OCF69421.1 hypothetical protein I203_01278 [Kwoniella mangroviensis CBS 8507]